MCRDLADTDRCTAGDFAGVCDQSVCIAGCGDSVQDEEECDDGNYVNHDGCSSQCTLEAPTWTQWKSEWTPRARHVAAHHAAANLLVMFGGADEVGTSDDHWEFALNGAWTRRDVPRPSARVGATMAYDELHQKIVLFGGTPDVITATAQGLADTWTYDGQSWTKLAPPASPPRRWGAAMAYAGNGRIVLFGGRDLGIPWLADTWEFDGTSWTPITSTLTPPGRFAAMMTWAPFTAAADRVVLFGGDRDDVGLGGLLADHWEYTTAGGWQPRSGPGFPTARRSGAIGYDALIDRVVMFGGVLNTVPSSSTWVFDGAAWSQVATEQVPEGRTDSVLVGGAVLTLVAGRAATGPLDDIWTFRLSNWKVRETPARPLVRSEAELVFDSDRQQTFSLGGLRDSGSVAEQSRFDGAAWYVEPDLPTTRSRFTAGYDSTRHQMMIFGGIVPMPTPATVIHTATGWSAYVGVEPPPRRNGAMAFREDTGQFVLFGGVTQSGNAFSDTWTFDTEWRPHSSSGPGLSIRAAMAYNPLRQQLVLFDEAGVTWTMTATGWDQLATMGPPPRSAGTMVFSPELSAILLYGGVANGTTVLGDLWMLIDDGWSKLEPKGEQPTVRQDPRLVAHRPLRSLVLHAGTTSSGRRLDDTWLFQYRSEVPDEICDNKVDDDGDRRVDRSDPDCP